MKIIIKNLKVETLIGVYDYERAVKNELIYNLEIKISSNNSAATDNLSDTLDYDAICNKVREVANSTNFKLLESLIVRLQEELFSSFPQIEYLKLRIAKKGVIKDCDVVEVEDEYLKPPSQG